MLISLFARMFQPHAGPQADPCRGGNPEAGLAGKRGRRQARGARGGGIILVSELTVPRGL